MEKKRKVKSIDEIYKVVLKGIELGYTDITFTGGEPLIRKRDIIEILERLSKENLLPDITIVTNGYLVDDELLDSIEKYGGYIKFNFSIHSVDREDYYKIINPANKDKNALNKIIENIDKIVKRGITIKLNVVLLKGINSSKEKISEIIEFGLKHKIKYIKFLELLVTEKLRGYYNYYFDVSSVKNYFENELVEIESAPRRKVYKYKDSNIKIEMQSCTCRLGCNKCIALRDKTVTSELEFFPCFVLNTEGIDVSDENLLENAFKEGDRKISEMAKKYKSGSPIIISNPIYYEEKTDIYYKSKIDNLEEIEKLFSSNGYKLERKTSLKEIYYEPKIITEKWQNYNKIMKMFSVNYIGEEWKEITQEIEYYDDEIFSSKTKFLNGAKEKIIKNRKEYEQMMEYIDFREKAELSWEINFWGNEDNEISCALNNESGKIIYRTSKKIKDENIVKQLSLENIREPIVRYILK